MQANEPAIPANFARGLDQEPVDPADETVGSFATEEQTQPHDHRRQLRFSEGLEAVREAPEKAAVRDFAESEKHGDACP
jgi:hypothetical protein